MSFSCIIPAYNEGPRIANVISAVLGCDDIDEVVVVDDGSTDNTWDEINKFDNPKLKKIQLRENAGKTNAVITGIRESIGEYIVMIDSDLLNLQSQHISYLIAPVRNKEVQICLSIRENSLYTFKFFGTDFVSGERVIPRSLFVDEQYYLSGPGFGLEVLMNEKIIENKYTIRNIYIPNLITPRKSFKYGYFRGTLADWKMNHDILKVVPLHLLMYQLWYFSRFYQK